MFTGGLNYAVHTISCCAMSRYATCYVMLAGYCSTFSQPQTLTRRGVRRARTLIWLNAYF